MKGILSVVAALLLLNVAALSLWSRAAPPPAAKGTRVGVFDMTHVVKNYEKFKKYQVEIEKLMAPFYAIDSRKRESVELIAQQLRDPDLAAERRTALEKKIARLQREVEANKDEARSALIKAQERLLTTLYTDIEAAARRLAREGGFDLVMHYKAVSPGTENWSPTSISRKMHTDGLVPIHIEPHIDLTEAILKELHEDMKRERK